MNRQERFEQEIQKITKVIREQYNPQKIILFGSVARGDFRDDSDIDMLVVKPSNQPRWKRSSEIYKLFFHDMYKIPFEPLVLTPDEFERGKRENRFLIRQILKDGRLLYET